MSQKFFHRNRNERKMGVKDLIPFVKRLHPNVFSTSLNEWRKRENKTVENLRIAIDVPILAFKLAYYEGTGMLVPKILSYAKNFRNTVGHPVFVFDGEWLAAKSRERAKRMIAIEKLPQPETVSTRCLFEGDAPIVVELGPPVFTRPCKADYKLMLAALIEAGYDCRIAKFEAEALCSKLCKDKLVDAVITEDSDVFAYCCPTVILRHGSTTHQCTVVDMSNILSSLELSQEEFVELCVLFGNDFNERIPRIGPVKSLKLLKTHETLEQVLEYLNTEDEKREEMMQSKQIFQSYCYEEEE